MNSKPTVVLLHGLARTGRSMAGLRRSLEQQGWPTWTCTYSSRQHGIADLARDVAERLHAEVSGPVVAVTHSLGGILVRHMGNRVPFQRVVMLAPPNQGSRVAQAFAGYAIFRWLYGPAGQQVVRAEDWPLPPWPFGVIAGTRAVSPWNPVSWATRGLGLLPPGEPSDGTVTVDETRLAQMADFATVPCTHTWIMDDPQVRRMVVHFLEHGQFWPPSP